MRNVLRMALPAILLAGCSADRSQAPALTGASLSPPAVRSDPEYTFTSIAFPDALSTTAFGINARGDVVGTYVDANRVSHGFRWRDGEFTTIDVPNAAGTDARGINPNGEIVGGYWMKGEPAVNIHGYRLTKHGEFIAVDFPGHTNTIPQRILPNGTILGCRHDGDMMGSMRGVIITRTENVDTEAFASMNNGATPDGKRVVGLYTNMMTALQEGYIIDDGVFASLVVPGSSTTAAWDINPAGEIVGVYRTSTGLHGFVLHDGAYQALDYPASTATRAFGINAGGSIVGNYVAGGKTRGFVASVVH